MSPFLESIKALLTEECEASLGTLDGDNPFVTAVNYLFEADSGEKLGNFYFLLSQLARHTRNIQKDPRASLLVLEEKSEVSILERKRATLIGKVEEVSSEEERERLQEKYLGLFPESEILFKLPDFRFYRLRPREAHWIGGFGQIQNLQIVQ